MRTNYKEERAWRSRRMLLFWRNCGSCEKICRTVFDLDSIIRQKETLEARTTSPDFWKKEESREVSREIARLQRSLDSWNDVERMYSDIVTLEEMLSENEDDDLQREFEQTAEKLRKFAEKEQLLLLLSEEHDSSNAILTVHAGSGGLDSQDWAEMLLRLYLR